MKKIAAILVLFGIIQTSLIPIFSQSISLPKTVFAPGEPISVSYSGLPGNKQDWISISAPGSADGNYIAWKYTEGNRSGTMNFDGLAYGNYEIRLYFNGENTVRARQPFRVGNVDQNATVKTHLPIYKPGEKIIVQFSGLPGNRQDWISISAPGSADGNYIAWKYTDGKQSGEMSFDGLTFGEYEVRIYFNGENTVRMRSSFRVGNVDQNVAVKTHLPNYKPGEKIIVQFSGLPGNSRDWISLSSAGSNDGNYVAWQYTNGSQSGNMNFDGLAAGNYEARVYFNGENTVRTRYPFTVGKTGSSASTKICRKELSIFYAGMASFGIAWGRLGSDVITPAVITEIQATLGNVIDGLNVIAQCVDFDANKIRNYSARLPGLTRVQAVNEIDQLIKELQGSINRARFTCDNGASLESLYVAAIHIGASQAIANTFVCRMIAPEWQTNLRNHLRMVEQGLRGFNACIPGVNPLLVNNVNVGAANAYEPFSTIVGIHMQVLWAVSLTDCCCYCK